MDEHPTPPRPPGSARWWLVLALVLAVVAGGAVVGLRTLLDPSEPETPPIPAPSTTSGPPPKSPPAPDQKAPVVVVPGKGALLPGIGTGVVYAQSADAIFRIDLGTGRVVRTATPRLEEHATFLAGPGWVLVKSRWSAAGVFVRDGQPATALPDQLDAEGYLHQGPGGRLWVEPEWGTDPLARTTIRLVELDGRTVPGRTVTAPSTSAPYGIVADGYGVLLLTNAGGIYQLVPSRPGQPSRIRLISRGTLVAVGGRRLLLWDCDGSARCGLVRLDQRTGGRTPVPAAIRTLLGEGSVGVDPDVYGDELLSPDGEHVAVTATEPSGRLRVHVIDLRTGHDGLLPGVAADANGNRQLAWSPNSRWLLALTDHQLRGYDTRTRASRTVPLGQEPLLHLTTVGAAGW